MNNKTYGIQGEQNNILFFIFTFYIKVYLIGYMLFDTRLPDDTENSNIIKQKISRETISFKNLERIRIESNNSFQIPQQFIVLRSVGLELAFANIFSFVFIMVAFLNKNIFQLKIFNFLILIQTVFFIAIIIDAELEGRIILLAILFLILNATDVFVNCITIYRAKPEFAWYYFKQISVDPQLLGKCFL